MFDLRNSLVSKKTGSHRNRRRGHMSTSAHVDRTELLECRTLLSGVRLDSSFGTGGRVNTEFKEGTRTSTVVLDSALQADGRIVAVGNGGIARFLPKRFARHVIWY